MDVDNTAYNYDGSATEDDGSCVYDLSGCTIIFLRIC